MWGNVKPLVFHCFVRLRQRPPRPGPLRQKTRPCQPDAFAELAARCARYRLGLREASTRDITWNHDAAP